MEHAIIYTILFTSFFLIFTGILQKFTARFTLLPYTVALLIAGALGQFLVHYLHIPVHLELSADMIYFVLLPLLLFESAFHINFHQFKLQFKTITFLATFGLLLSIFTIGYTLAIALNYPLDVAILFGAIISATDPIAVISLFKTLGAPKRLGLLADGESMLNDATGVIAFRVISGFVVTSASFQSQAVLGSFGNFMYVFIGSIFFGAILGYIFSKIIEKIENDRVVETTMTVAAAIGSFTAAEHFFQLSGVISTVITGIVIGNLGKTKFSPGVRSFVEEFWAYFAYLSVSLVFFFATFNLDFTIFAKNPQPIFIAIAAVLIGRTVSVYGTILLTNRLPFFNDEPNIPMSWQHILNWGGLRGVIPLVLVYSLPETFQYRDDMLRFTLGAFLFTLCINGLTIRNLLFALRLHLPKKEEEIMHEEMTIYELEEAKEVLKKLKEQEFDPDLLQTISKEITEEEKKHKIHLKEIASDEDLELSIRLQVIQIERDVLHDLYEKSQISENVHFDFETELDLQQDALEYPEVYEGRGILEGGKIHSGRSYRKRIGRLRSLANYVPFLKPFLRSPREAIIQDRLGLLKARIETSEQVRDYLKKLQRFMKDQEIAQNILDTIIQEQEELIEDNRKEYKRISTEHPRVLEAYQRKLAYTHIHSGNTLVPSH